MSEFLYDKDIMWPLRNPVLSSDMIKRFNRKMSAKHINFRNRLVSCLPSTRLVAVDVTQLGSLLSNRELQINRSQNQD